MDERALFTVSAMIRVTTAFAVLLCAAPAGAQTVPLTPRKPVHAALSAADTARYAVDADSGALVRISVVQTSVDVAVRILSPRGRPIRMVNASVHGAERVQFEATEKGIHRIDLMPVASGAGAYVIALEARERLSGDPKRLAAQLLAPWDRDDGPGAVVGVWRGGKTLYANAHGMANLTYGIPFTTATPTNIGSTSKQFTAFAVLLLAEQGKLALDDDVRKHVPELPDLGKVVTIRHLLSHTSGYREFLNTILLTGRRIDHGDFIDRVELISLVQRQPALQNDPGAEFNYNNTGFGLAATIVERVSGLSYPEFMAAHLFRPLGMTRTMVRPSPEAIVPGMSEGYTPADKGGWRAVGDLGGAMGAGGIYSTVGDLQKWAQNFLHPTVGSAAIVRQMITPFTLTTGRSTGYGFGLFIDTQGRLIRIQHGGADLAHRSQLVYYPEIDAGITVQSNDAGFDAGIAFRLAEAFFGASMHGGGSANAFDPKTFKPEGFDDFVGRYALDAVPTFVLTFTRSGDSLFTQATGQPRFPIVPTSDSTFELKVVAASMTFHREPDGKVQSVTLHQGGANQRATRVTGEAAKAWYPTVAQLRQFEGRYFSPELEAFQTITMRDGALTLEQRRVDPVKLAAGSSDVFVGGTGTLSFERDRNGQVIGYYVSNVRTRGVRFERSRY